MHSDADMWRWTSIFSAMHSPESREQREGQQCLARAREGEKAYMFREAVLRRLFAVSNAGKFIIFIVPATSVAIVRDRRTRHGRLAHLLMEREFMERGPFTRNKNQLQIINDVAF